MHKERVARWHVVKVVTWSIVNSLAGRETATMDQLDNDLDQHLLHQFSCLGTTDKDDLVKQLQKMLAGSHLNETTAEFFLDMNNW